MAPTYEDKMKRAMAAVNAGMTKKGAARKFGIPPSTLRDHIKRAAKQAQAKQTQLPVLPTASPAPTAPTAPFPLSSTPPTPSPTPSLSPRFTQLQEMHLRQLISSRYALGIPYSHQEFLALATRALYAHAGPGPSLSPGHDEVLGQGWLDDFLERNGEEIVLFVGLARDG